MASELEKLQLEEAEAMEALAAEGAELLKQSEALEQRRLSIQAKFESERESLRSSTSAEAPPPPPPEPVSDVAEVLLALAAKPKLPEVVDGEEPPAEDVPEPPPFGSCILSVAASEWGAPSEPPALLHVPVTSAGTVSLTLTRNATYLISCLSMLPEGLAGEAMAMEAPIGEAPADEPLDGEEGVVP